VRPRLHRRNLVVWNSSARPVGRYGAPRFTRLARTRRIRWWIRTGAQLAVIGLMRFARAVRTRRGARLLLTGTALTVAGMILPSGLPSGVTFIVGMLVFLRGVAVALGVSERQRRFDGAPAAGAGYFGVGTLPSSEPHDHRARAVTGQS
jgi:hypothetical protein